MTNEYYINAHTDATNMATALVRNGYVVTISMGYKPSDYWKSENMYKLVVQSEAVEKEDDD